MQKGLYHKKGVRLMFFDAIKTEPIPERVFSLSCFVADQGPIKEKDLESRFIPKNLNTARTSYFRPILDTAKELKLIGTNENEDIVFLGDRNSISSLKSMRKYCNSLIFCGDFKSTNFYKIISCFLSANDDWLSLGSITGSDEIIKKIHEQTGIPTTTLKKDVLLAIRFWINYLGFGYFHEKYMVFLPNMYTALHDFIDLGNVENGVEYTIEEFINLLHEGAYVALKQSRVTQKLNLAMSNALRLMHDNKEIELSRRLDSEKVWQLFPNPEHVFVSEISHVVVNKAVNR